MSDLKILSDPDERDVIDNARGTMPVPANDAVLNRRDLDLIKRDLISVRKDYREIRDNMVVLTHQYSRAPSRSFFVIFGLFWLVLLAGLILAQPHLASLSEHVMDLIPHR